MNKICRQIVHTCIQPIFVYICRCTHKSIYTVISRAFASHTLGRFPICYDSTEFSKPKLLLQIGRAANTADHEHFCMRSKKSLNNAVVFLRRPFPLRKLYPKVEMTTKEPAENKRQQIIEPQPHPNSVSPPR